MRNNVVMMATIFGCYSNLYPDPLISRWPPGCLPFAKGVVRGRIRGNEQARKWALEGTKKNSAKLCC